MKTRRLQAQLASWGSPRSSQHRYTPSVLHRQWGQDIWKEEDKTQSSPAPSAKNLHVEGTLGALSSNLLCFCGERGAEIKSVTQDRSDARPTWAPHSSRALPLQSVALLFTGLPCSTVAAEA